MMNPVLAFSILLVLSNITALHAFGQQPHSWNQPPSSQTLKDTPGLLHDSFSSQSMKTRVGYCVVLPPSYGLDAQRRFPVVYWLHGGGGNECSDIWTSRIWQRMQRNKTIGEVILVYPNGGRSSYWDHHDGIVMMESMIMEELIPRVDEKFRTIAARNARAVHGFSMGASGALKFLMKYPERFCSAVAFGGGAIDLENTNLPFVKKIIQRNLDGDPILIRKNNTYRLLDNNVSKIRRFDVKVLQICGGSDTWKTSASEFETALTQHGIKNELVIVPDVAHEINRLFRVEGVASAKFQDTVFEEARSSIADAKNESTR